MGREKNKKYRDRDVDRLIGLETEKERKRIVSNGRG